MQKIKKIVKILFGVLGTFVGLTMLLGRSSKKKTIEIKKDIKNNELETKKIKEKQKEVEKEKNNIKEEIKRGLKDIEESKKTEPIVEKKSIEDAKKSLKKRLNGESS